MNNGTKRFNSEPYINKYSHRIAQGSRETVSKSNSADYVAIPLSSVSINPQNSNIQNNQNEQNKKCCCVDFCDCLRGINKTCFLCGMSLVNIAVYTYFLYSGIIFAKNIKLTLIPYIINILLIGMICIHKYCMKDNKCLQCFYLIFLIAVTISLLMINCYTFYLWILQYCLNQV
ncbi:hypothetical protein BDAP_000036 [Binucleata daphniae]